MKLIAWCNTRVLWGKSSSSSNRILIITLETGYSKQWKHKIKSWNIMIFVRILLLLIVRTCHCVTEFISKSLKVILSWRIYYTFFSIHNLNTCQRFIHPAHLKNSEIVIYMARVIQIDNACLSHRLFSKQLQFLEN